MARHIETTRPETLDAARKILHASATVRGLTMLTLATELGTSKSSAYRYFDGRDALVVALVAEACDYAEASLRIATDATDDDVAAILRDLVANVPGALLETRGGKRDQIPAAARERLTLCLADVHGYLADHYVAGLALALYAAVSTPPSMLPTSREDALDGALALVAMLAA